MECLDRLPATFTYQQAIDLGVPRRRLDQWRGQGLVEPIGRGLFRQVTASIADLDLIEVTHRAPEATLCLTSALVRHGLSDAIPAEHDIAVPRGRRTPAVTAPVRWHRFDPATFTIGRETTPLDEETAIGLYSPARTIVDVFRLISSQGSDLAYDALRKWLRAGGRPADLLDVARHFPRTLTRLRSALEVLL